MPEKPSTPLLVRGATVLTLDPEARVLAPGDVLVADGRIRALGRDLVAPEGATILARPGAFVLPGLIQGHVHLGQTFFRGLAEGRRLLPWLRQRIWPLEAAHDDASAYACGLLGAAECLLAGTTTIQDIGIGPGAAGLLGAIAESGLRAIAGPCLMDEGEALPRGLASDADNALAAAETLGERFAGSRRLHAAVNPRFILSCSDALWQGAQALAARRGWPIHTHALEQRDETALVRSLKGGRDEIDYFADTGVLDSDLRLAHGVWVEAGHRPRLAASGAAIVHCPSSNFKLGSGIADALGLERAGIAVGLGCDGAACANHFDAFEELRLAAHVATWHHGPSPGRGLWALRLATSQGAHALGLAEQIGSLEAGKCADLVVLDPGFRGGRPDLDAAPGADVHDLIAWSGSRAHVRDVLIDGELLVADASLRCLDLRDLRRRAAEARQALLARAGLSL